MPSVQDIQKFNKSLVSLGSEPAIQARRGEEVDDVPPPEEGLSSDISDLLGEEEAQPEADSPPEQPADQSEESYEISEEPDVFGEEPEEAGEAVSEPEEAAEAEAEPEEAVGPETGPEEAAEPDFSEEALFGGESETEEGPATEGEESFEDLGEFEGDEDFFSQFAEAMELGEEETAAEGPEEGLEAAETATEGAEEAEGEAGDFADEAFELPDDLGIDEEPVGEESREPAAEPDEAAEDDAFALPEGFDMEPESEGEADEEPAGEPWEAGEAWEAGEEFSFEAESEGAEGLTGEETEDDDFDVDEFSLGDFGEEFGVLEEEEGGTEEDLNPALDVSGGPPDAPAAEAEAAETELSDEDFAALRQRLEELPLNVKVAVEEAIGEGYGTADQQQELIDLLVHGESARVIADRTGKMLRRQIQVPRGYEKRSGAVFEEQQGTLLYQFRENLLPILRVVVLAVVLVAALTYLGYRFVYQPLLARSIYEQGLAAIDAGEYQLGNQRFDRAVDIRRVKDRYYQYAGRFRDERQYGLAEEKYEQLLTHYPGDKRGILEYANLESATLADYEHADSLLQRLIDEDIRDYEARLAMGDNFMRWADSLEGDAQAERYEQARQAYARLMEYYGQTDPLMFRMLRYFMRVDNEEEVMRVKTALEQREDLQINAPIYAELGGYLIDKNELEDVREILLETLEVNDRLPEAHYHLARYFKINSEFSSELTALNNVLSLANAQERFDQRELAILVDTRRRLGDYYYRQEEYVTAEEHYLAGIRRFEEGLAAGALEPEERFGELYAALADIYYYVSHDYEQALTRLNRAEELGYSNRAVNYKQGFIQYRQDDYAPAINNFMDAAGSFTENRPLLYATANALYHRQSYSAAEGYYRQLLDILERQRAQIPTLLVDEDEEHQAIVEYLIKVHNNLGAALYRIYQRGSQNDMLSESLVHLERSTELSVNFGRNPETGERSERVDLAQLNMRHVLYPETDYTVQLYNNLPVDTDDLVF